MKALTGFGLTEQQFAHLVGKARMFQYLPSKIKKEIDPFPLVDNQVSLITKDYYRDDSFCRSENGDIDLWRLFNLFSGANKNSYIDTFVDRGAGSFSFVETIKSSIEQKAENWYLPN